MNIYSALKGVSQIYLDTAPVIYYVQGVTPFFPVVSRWAEINAAQIPLEKKLSFPPMAAPRLRGGRLRGGKGGNPQHIGEERKVQLIMFTYLDALFQEIERGKLQAISSPVTLAECMVLPLRLGDSALQQNFLDCSLIRKG